NTAVIVVAGNAQQVDTGAESGDVQCHVTGTTGTVFNILNFDHRHRRFRRNTRGGTLPVTVEHNVAKDQDAGIVKIRQGNIHKPELLRWWKRPQFITGLARWVLPVKSAVV